MPAIDFPADSPLGQLSSQWHHVMKRSNFATREPGVILVFVIVFLVGCALLGVLINRQINKARS